MKSTDRLSRALFTRGSGTNALWDKGAAIFIRSKSAIDDLWSHFRKFVRYREADGRWTYFRFWDAAYLYQYALSHHEDAAPYLAHLLGVGIVCIPTPSKSTLLVVKNSAPEAPISLPQRSSAGHWPFFHEDMARIRLEKFVDEIETTLLS
ncbi:DUF4123 domain-containing protein [Thioclava litoralis]|uniref:DUF4123 domain-containing protein n=1 Tax=Thioclava litoralis TaxID=3076557 RepID=A0ABZ1DZA7_9RHOB|nr:DUF4123 domain-containing protein [Thioclava sp. FTW29]